MHLKLLSVSAACLTLLLPLAACNTSSGVPAAYQELEAADAKVDQVDAAMMISSYRAQYGLGPVVADKGLQRQAKALSEQLAKAGDRPANAAKASAKTAKSGVYMVSHTSAGYRRWAEAFSGWRHSPQHSAAMLDPKVTRIGLATTYNPSSKYKVFWGLVAAGPEGK
ncbi:CAP domain-containing protein [Rhodobacteraceae bacterium RKSG542]|uniref:CAP domain-containing protein n=1 Tax=Pseudovibrio flavus TaxID=2529854 RepID=UPI0012BCC674|nr:CAP domain-containing protein [Pseudovibrio flavus]MTI18331.1 CAP domain-containing protein [Pseudovibrio flavus]